MHINTRLFIALVVASLIALSVNDNRRAAAAFSFRQADKLRDPQFIAEGAKLFAPICGNAYCHGAGGKGGGAPRLRGKSFDGAFLFKTISNGIPGTGMLSFKSELSEEQIWRLVAFVASQSDAPPPAVSEALPNPAAPPRSPEASSTGSLVGSATSGRALFFDSSQHRACYACHSFDGEGTTIGPDLSRFGNKSPRELLSSIILPREVKDPRYAAVTITLRNGDKIIGVKKEEDAESIRVYDTAELPAVLRTIQKVDIAKSEIASESIMPNDYASTYTMKQLLDLVTFLRSSQSQAPVTLRDLF